MLADHGERARAQQEDDGRQIEVAGTAVSCDTSDRHPERDGHREYRQTAQQGTQLKGRCAQQGAEQGGILLLVERSLEYVDDGVVPEACRAAIEECV